MPGTMVRMGRLLVLTAFTWTALAVQGQSKVCPGDCDANGRTESVEIAAAVHALFGQAAVCGGETGSASVAFLVQALSYAALDRPICAAGGRSRWEDLAPLPGGPRQEVGVAALGDEVFVIGGITSRAVGVSTVEAYRVSQGRWRTVARLPRPLHHVAATADERFVYAAGGFAGASFTPVSEVFRYDPTRDVWEPLPPLPLAVGAAACAVTRRELHVVGGAAGLASSAQHAVLNLDTMTWSTATPLPEALNHLGAVVWNENLYVVGGRHDPSGLANSSALYRWDAGTNAWQTLAPMPTARSGHAAGVVGRWLVVFGGEVDPLRSPQFVFPQVEAYDLSRDRWFSDVSMPVPRHGFGAAVVGTAVYLPGGATRAGFGETDRHDRWVIEE
ncbi:MAG: hypothetical protein KatS3mg077_3323 [Candidatus Binatia bacterium]|nr:MAG: hypothetical protein KatS3mg077_3323 [Candidatus Binatia bacterium]